MWKIVICVYAQLMVTSAVTLITLDVGDPVLYAMKPRRISCKFKNFPKGTRYMTLSFSDRRTVMLDVRSNLTISLPNKRKLKILPKDEIVVVHSQSSSREIQAILNPLPRDDNAAITCSAHGPNFRRVPDTIISLAERIEVRWPPSIHNVSIKGLDGSPPAADHLAAIRCLVKMGDRSREKDELVTATVGGTDLGDPQTINDLPADRVGYEWMAVTWHYKFLTKDNETLVVCSLKSKGVEDEKSVTLMEFTNAPKNLVVSPGKKELLAEVTVEAFRIDYVPYLISAAVIFGVGLLLGIIFIRIRRRRALKMNEVETPLSDKERADNAEKRQTADDTQAEIGQTSAMESGSYLSINQMNIYEEMDYEEMDQEVDYEIDDYAEASHSDDKTNKT